MQFNQLFELSPKKKLAISLLWDFTALLLATVFAFLIRLGVTDWDFSYVDVVIILLNVTFALVLLSMFGHYRQMIRYIELNTIPKALLLLAVSSFLSVIIHSLLVLEDF